MDNEELKTILEKGNDALKQKDWSLARLWYEKAISIDQHCKEAYFGKYLSKIEISDLDELSSNQLILFSREYVQRACHRNDYDWMIQKYTYQWAEEKGLLVDVWYRYGCQLASGHFYEEAASQFEQCGEYKDSKKKAEACQILYKLKKKLPKYNEIEDWMRIRDLKALPYILLFLQIPLLVLIGGAELFSTSNSTGFAWIAVVLLGILIVMGMVVLSKFKASSAMGKVILFFVSFATICTGPIFPIVVICIKYKRKKRYEKIKKTILVAYMEELKQYMCSKNILDEADGAGIDTFMVDMMC